MLCQNNNSYAKVKRTMEDRQEMEEGRDGHPKVTINGAAYVINKQAFYKRDTVVVDKSHTKIMQQ